MNSRTPFRVMISVFKFKISVFRLVKRGIRLPPVVSSFALIMTLLLSGVVWASKSRCFALQKDQNESVELRLCLVHKGVAMPSGLKPVDIFVKANDGASIVFRSSGLMVESATSEQGGDDSVYVVLDQVKERSIFYPLRSSLHQLFSPIHFKGRRSFEKVNGKGVVYLGSDVYTYTQYPVTEKNALGLSAR